MPEILLESRRFVNKNIHFLNNRLILLKPPDDPLASGDG